MMIRKKEQIKAQISVACYVTVRERGRERGRKKKVGRIHAGCSKICVRAGLSIVGKYDIYTNLSLGLSIPNCIHSKVRLENCFKQRDIP